MAELHEGLRRTPIYDRHVALGARIVPFAGWEMPVQYSGILDEVRAVRSGSGLFDVSHMGRVEITGADSPTFLNRLFSSDVLELRTGRARYGVICTEGGGIVDDCILYRLAEHRFMLVPNASNTPAVLEWIYRWVVARDDVRISDLTDSTSMVAVQGPGAEDLLADLTSLDLSKLRLFRARETTVGGNNVLLARTGYTGEDGFEIMPPSSNVVALWDFLIDGGATPCGLGARDVLRLEAGLLLHGNDIDSTTNPYEAGMDRFIDPDREGYVAGGALQGIRNGSLRRVLVGFTMVGRGIARHGFPILDGNEQIGVVSSGSYSPTLDTNIGLGYVPTAFSAPETRFQIDVRGRAVDAEVTKLPFYSRS